MRDSDVRGEERAERVVLVSPWWCRVDVPCLARRGRIVLEPAFGESRRVEEEDVDVRGELLLESSP